MSYLALYRRYRPTTFKGLIGQEHIVKTLVNQIKNDRLGHAYLFTGTRGTGKTSAAKIFAKAINCEHPVDGSPCGKCPTCLALADPSNIDISEIDAASNNGVNEIRDLREKVQYPPVSCKYKVYIIDEVHMLTGAAFNALLKTLEEPPKHAVFILATTEAHKIPATILSRCMRFDFRLISTEKIAELIGKIYDEQGKDYEKEGVFAIAKAGEGSIRDALSIADTAISYGTGKLTYNDVTEILGSSNSELLHDFTEYILKGESGKVLECINKLCGLGKSMGVLTKDLTATLRDLLVIKTCATAKSILGLPETEFEKLKRLADSTNESRLVRIMEIFANAENQLRFTNHPRVVFETASIKATKPDSDYNIDALLSRIKTLEDKISSGSYVTDTKPLPSSKVEKEEKSVGKENIDNTDNGKNNARLSLSESDADTVKGRLIYNLRKAGSEMLYNVLSGISLDISGNTVRLYPGSVSDYEILSMNANIEKILVALSEFESVKVKIVEPKTEQRLDSVDEATDKIKKIFGEDIVIVKD